MGCSKSVILVTSQSEYLLLTEQLFLQEAFDYLITTESNKKFISGELELSTNCLTRLLGQRKFFRRQRMLKVSGQRNR